VRVFSGIYSACRLSSAGIAIFAGNQTEWHRHVEGVTQKTDEIAEERCLDTFDMLPNLLHC